MSQSRAKQLWDLFIEAECGSWEKSAWCDIFLSQVLSELHNGRAIQEILNFGNFNGIGTLIGCEILSDVNQVVNVPDDTEDLEPLRSYLLSKGWRGLAVLHAMGNLNLACSNELANLLLYLYPLCLKKPNYGTTCNMYINLKPSVVQDISLPKTPAKIKHAPSHSALSPRAEYQRAFSHSSARSRRAIFNEVSEEIGMNVSSDEPDHAACALQTGGGLFKLDPMDFDYFTSVVRSDDESRLDSVLYEPPRKASRAVPPHPRDLVDAAINTIMESAVSPYEFRILLVQLLTALAMAEHTISVCPDNSFPTCTQCIKFAIENLHSLQFHKQSDTFTVEEAVELKVSLTQLLVLCLDKAIGCSDVTCSVILAGILPMMLSVLEDVINKINIEPETDLSMRLEEVAYGLLCGIIGFLHSLLLQVSTPNSLTCEPFLEMVNKMVDSGGGLLLERSVYTLQERSRRFLELLSQLVIDVKRLRLRLSLPSDNKSRKRKQKSLGDSHHHNDVFGSVVSTPLSPSKPLCCINKLTMVFIKLLLNSEKLSKELTHLLLRILTNCGVCCCMPVKPLIKALVKLVKDGHVKTRILGFSLLEKTIYPQLGAYDIIGYKVICKHCKHNGETMWEELERFRDIVINRENKQGHSVICHLIRIAPVVRVGVKEILLFKIFFPIFVESKTEYLKTKSEHSEFLILSALSLFASILSESLVQHFITLRGVSHLLDLIYLPNFSKHCCAVLEKAIVCELNQSTELTGVFSLNMLQTSAEMATESFLKKAGVNCIRRRVMGRKRGGNQFINSGHTIELMQSVAVFWRSYACLTLTNTTLRAHFAQNSVLNDCQSLFNVALGYFTKTRSMDHLEESEPYNHCLPRLVESLLTFLLVTSPPDSDVEEKTIQKLATALKECNIKTVDIKKVCEVVIKCSLARPNVSLLFETPKVPVMPVWSHWAEGAPEDEISSESTCSGEDDYVTADEGYDADVELKTSICIGNNLIESESSNHADGPGEKSSPIIIYPKLCTLIIEFVVRAFSERSKINIIEALEDSLMAVLSRLAALCKDNPINCAALCRQMVVTILLKGFRSCLADNNSQFQGLRKIVLNLVLDLARHAITPEELGEYLQFFKTDNPPLAELLEPLITLASEQDMRPYFHLSFPVLSPQDLDTTNDKCINRLHRRQDVTSCWSTCAVKLLIPGQFGWSPWLTGASVSLWVRVDRGSVLNRPMGSRKVSLCPVDNVRRTSLCPPQSNRKVSHAESHISAFSTGPSDWGLSVDEESKPSLPSKPVSIKKQFHLLSFGSENFILECWVDILSSAVNLRLTRVDPNNGYEIICEQMIDGGLVSGKWHHIGINIRDFVNSKRTTVEVTWILDGYWEIKTQLSFIGLLNRKPRDVFVLLGHQATDIDPKTSLSLANLFVFRSAVFTKSRAMGLISLGPNLINFADCRVAKPFRNLSPSITVAAVESGVDWNYILGDLDFGQLAESLLLAYSAHDPNTIAMYQGSSSISASSLLFRSASVEPCVAQLPPVHSLPTIFAPLLSKKDETIVPASYLLGGSSVFLYLFARVVELKASDAEQADALFLLLRLVQLDLNLYSQFINYDYHKLLGKIFRSRLCTPNLYLLKAIFDACCDKPLIIDTMNGLVVNTSSTAIIKNSLLLSTLINIWLDTAVSSSLLLAMFVSLQALITDEHPYREFNVAQLNRVRAMKTLLNFCKDRLKNEEKPAVDGEVWTSVVELVKSLMGAPPEFSHVVAVMDTLLLLHPANATYITHLKKSFYLVLSVGHNYTSQAVAHDPQALRNLMRTASMNFEKYAQTLKTNVPRNEEYANSVDAGKLSKALANLQLRNSSTSSCHSPKEDEEMDSNRYSDDVTLDSGISDTCRENLDQENNIVKAVDGSQQNLGSFFPSINVTFEDKVEAEKQEKCITEVQEKVNWDFVVTEGFLLQLRDVLLVLPDNMAHQVLTHVTKFEILLVMANHQNHAVRAAVVQLISSYLKRANDDERNKFMKAKGFYHLANQIALYPASEDLAEACLNLITPCAVPLDNLSFIAEMDFSHIELASLPPLLALLPRSVHDCVLTHKLINALRTIFCKNTSCAKMLLDHGIVEVLVKALLASAHISYVSHQITSQDIVVSDLQAFLVLIATHFLNCPGIGNMQIICDIRFELHYVGRVERDSCKLDAHCVSVIRDTQCRFLERCLDLLLEKVLALQTDSRSQTSFTLEDTEVDASNVESFAVAAGSEIEKYEQYLVPDASFF